MGSAIFMPFLSPEALLAPSIGIPTAPPIAPLIEHNESLVSLAGDIAVEQRLFASSTYTAAGAFANGPLDHLGPRSRTPDLLACQDDAAPVSRLDPNAATQDMVREIERSLVEGRTQQAVDQVRKVGDLFRPFSPPQKIRSAIRLLLEKMLDKCQASGRIDDEFILTCELLRLTPSSSYYIFKKRRLLTILAKKAYDSGDYGSAAARMKQALEISEGNVKDLTLYAQILMRLDRTVTAAQILDDLLELGNRDSIILTLRTRLYIADNDFANARILLDEMKGIITNKPIDVWIYHELSGMLCENTARSLKPGDRAELFQSALEHYKKALAVSPCDHEILQAVGTMCVEVGLFDDAIAYYNKALAANSNAENNFLILRGLGRASRGKAIELRAANDHDGALQALDTGIPALEEALKMDEGNNNIRKKLAILMHLKADILLQDKNNPSMAMDIMRVIVSRSIKYIDMEAAIKIFQAYDVANEHAMYGPATLELMRNAELRLSDVIDRNPHALSAHVNLAIIFHHFSVYSELKGRKKEAARYVSMEKDCLSRAKGDK